MQTLSLPWKVDRLFPIDPRLKEKHVKEIMEVKNSWKNPIVAKKRKRHSFLNGRKREKMNKLKQMEYYFANVLSFLTLPVSEKKNVILFFSFFFWIFGVHTCYLYQHKYRVTLLTTMQVHVKILPSVLRLYWDLNPSFIAVPFYSQPSPIK